MNDYFKKVGEIVSSNTSSFTAQCLKEDSSTLTLPQAPYFGSFVIAKSEEIGFDIIAVVFDISSGSIDSVHRPTAMNLTRAELRFQQPQIFDLLKTDFSAITVGYLKDGKIYQSVPPHPPQIHDFVYSCTNNQVKEITDNLDYIRTLLNSGSNMCEDIIEANLRFSYLARGNNRDFLISAGRELSNLLKDNYDRLSAILRRIKP